MYCYSVKDPDQKTLIRIFYYNLRKYQGIIRCLISFGTIQDMLNIVLAIVGKYMVTRGSIARMRLFPFRIQFGAGPVDQPLVILGSMT